MTRQVAIVAFEGFELLDLAGPMTVFQMAATLAPALVPRLRAARRGPLYAVQAVSHRGGPVASITGVEVSTQAWSAVAPGTVIVPGGAPLRERQALAELQALTPWLQAQSRGRRRITSVCTGAFALAAAGLLDGRRATTHWRHAATLQQLHPAVRVDSDRIFIHDGPVWTSAGISAGIDLALALVEEDHGPALAQAVAGEMVVYHRRAGGQSQFSSLLAMSPGSERMRAVLDHIRSHLTTALTVDDLAEVACLSPRQFARSFRAETGQTPAKAVERIRAEAARLRIEAGDGSVATVARASGFGDEERMRRAFIRLYGQAPQAVRRAARGGTRTV